MVALVSAQRIGLVRAARRHQNAVVPSIATGTAPLQIEMPQMVVIAHAMVVMRARIVRRSHIGSSRHGPGSRLGGDWWR